MPRLWPSLLIKEIANKLIDCNWNNKRYGHDANDVIENPLAKPFPWWYELYQRIKLFPWWAKYNFGLTNQSDLKEKIISIAIELNLEKRVKKLIRHAVSEFSRKGLDKIIMAIIILITIFKQHTLHYFLLRTIYYNPIKKSLFQMRI